MIDDKDFPMEAAIFLAKLTAGQRVNLAKMAQSYGNKTAAQDARRDERTKPAMDGFQGKTFDEMFPNANRLKKGL